MRFFGLLLIVTPEVFGGLCQDICLRNHAIRVVIDDSGFSLTINCMESSLNRQQFLIGEIW